MKNKIILMVCIALMFVNMASGAVLITELGDQTSTDNNQAGFIYWQPLNTTSTGTSISVSINVQSQAGNARIALYNNSGFAPVALLNETSSQALTAGWNNFSLIYNITAGNEYWLATQMSNVANVNYRNANGALRYAAQAYGAFPATAPVLTSATRTLNMRIAVETPNNVLPIISSNNTQYQNNTASIATYSGIYEKLKIITLTENYTGSFKTYLGFNGNAKIYKNGIAAGTEHALGFPSNVEFNDTFTSQTLSFGDTIEVWGKTNDLNPIGVYNFKIKFDYDYVNSTPVLLYPTNTSTISFTFPPQFADVNFSWLPIGASGYQIQVAKDSNFNIMVADTTTTNNYSLHSLDASVYYWKVRTYNDGGATLGAWSGTYSFTFISSASGTAGTVLNGVVYELVGTNSVPVSAATVYISNATQTQQFFTGSNGYYQFTNLTNLTTYSVYAIKQGYDNTQTFLVVPVSNATTTLNLPIRIYISPYIPNFVFEKIVVRTLYDQAYTGLTINVYKGNALAVSNTGTTDNNGVVVFQLIKDTYYRMEISGGSLTSTVTMFFYAKEETQRITVASGFPTGGNKYIDINSTLFVTTVNATHSNLSLYYSDNSSLTSVINFYAKNWTTGAYQCANQTSATYPITLTCAVVSNGTYQFGFNATRSKYGVFQQDKVINFNASNASVPQGGLNGKIGVATLNWLSIIGLIVVGSLFSYKSVRYGVVIVPLLAVFLYWFGVLQVSAILVHSALVLGVLVYMRLSEQKVVT